jgi:Porin subfamily
MDVMAQRAIVLSTLSLAACLAASGVRAADAAAPLRDNGRCRSLGEGFLAVPGSDACVRFSGYVDAGADFDSPPRAAPASGPLQAPAAPVLRAGAGAAFDARMDTPMGPARAYLELGRPGLDP